MNSTLPLITIVTFLPLVGAVILLFQRKDDAETLKRTALTVAALVFGVSLLFVVRIGSIGGFDLTQAGFQYYEKHAWIRDVQHQL